MNGSSPGSREFIALAALMMSLAAFSIDAVLPALDAVRADLGVADPNDAQLVVSVLLAGMGAGHLLYGPVSDAVGRKPAIAAGIGIFLLGTLVVLASQSFAAMLAGRLLQGLGAGAPRTVIVALVRDQFEGRMMARVMSFVMSVFVLVPVFAPAVGQGILLVAEWRAIFGVLLAAGTLALTWFLLRQPETLAPARRRPFSLANIASALVEILTNRVSLGYTLAAGLVFGAFVGYLSTAQQLLQVAYGLGKAFPVAFGALAAAIGVASVVNARLVMRFGMRRLNAASAWTMAGWSSLFWLAAWLHGGLPPLALLAAWLLPGFFCLGVLFGNVHAQAMEPLGHIAGIGAAVIGSLSMLLSVPLGATIGQLYDGTALPLAGGFALLSLASALVMRWAGRDLRPGAEPSRDDTAG